MKKILFFILSSIFILFETLAQLPENLVPNMDFEFQSNIPYNDCSHLGGLTNWSEIPLDYGSPDRISHKLHYYVGGCNYIKCPNNPLGGDKYLFLGRDYKSPNGETIFNNLNSNLIPGKKYKLRIWATGRRFDGFAVRFLKKYRDWGANTPPPIYFTIPSANPNDECKAFAFESVFTVDKDDLNIIAIYSTSGSDGNCYVYIDNVEVYEYCTEYLVRQGRIYKQDKEIEEANHIIAGAVYNNIDMGPVTAIPGSITVYKGETDVSLRYDFNVERGADFTAKIGQCGSDCPSTNIETENYTLCSNECIKIGVFQFRGLTYEWTSPNIDFIPLLSSTTVASPIFCPLDDQPRTYEYKVKIKNNCGEITEKTVYISYNPSSNSTPDFSVIENNLDLNPTYPNLKIQVSPNTEKLRIDIYDCNGNIIHTASYLAGIDFNVNSPFSWTLDKYLSPCSCYKIKISTKNFCYEAIREEYFSWDRPKQPTNVELPTLAFCKDGQRWICMNGDGISSAEFIFFNRYGNTTGTKFINVNSNPICFPIPNGSGLPDGTYYLTVNLRGCDGDIVTFDRTTIYFPPCDNLIGNDNPDTRFSAEDVNSSDSLYFSIYPNPIQNQNQITYHIPQDGHVKIQILNSNLEGMKTLIDTELRKGNYVSDFSGADMSIGISYILIECFYDGVNQKIIKRVLRQ